MNFKFQVILPKAYNCLHLKNVAQSFRAASIGTAKAVHYRFNKDVLNDRNGNYFMPPLISHCEELSDEAISLRLSIIYFFVPMNRDSQ